ATMSTSLEYSRGLCRSALRQGDALMPLAGPPQVPAGHRGDRPRLGGLHRPVEDFLRDGGAAQHTPAHRTPHLRLDPPGAGRLDQGAQPLPQPHGDETDGQVEHLDHPVGRAGEDLPVGQPKVDHKHPPEDGQENPAGPQPRQACADGQNPEGEHEDEARPDVEGDEIEGVARPEEKAEDHQDDTSKAHQHLRHDGHHVHLAIRPPRRRKSAYSAGPWHGCHSPENRRDLQQGLSSVQPSGTLLPRTRFRTAPGWAPLPQVREGAGGVAGPTGKRDGMMEPHGPAEISWTHLETPLGPMVAAATAQGLCLLTFAEEAAEALARLRRYIPGPVIDRWHPRLEQTQEELTQYFTGQRRTFSVPLLAPGTPFERRVWSELLRIPYGETRSYKEIAAAIGR